MAKFATVLIVYLNNEGAAPVLHIGVSTSTGSRQIADFQTPGKILEARTRSKVGGVDKVTIRLILSHECQGKCSGRLSRQNCLQDAHNMHTSVRCKSASFNKAAI